MQAPVVYVHMLMLERCIMIVHQELDIHKCMQTFFLMIILSY